MCMSVWGYAPARGQKTVADLLELELETDVNKRLWALGSSLQWAAWQPLHSVCEGAVVGSRPESLPVSHLSPFPHDDVFPITSCLPTYKQLFLS